ncbi:MAG: hypothetical protein ABH864_05025 [archaeon]
MNLRLQDQQNRLADEGASPEVVWGADDFEALRASFPDIVLLEDRPNYRSWGLDGGLEIAYRCGPCQRIIVGTPKAGREDENVYCHRCGANLTDNQL